MLPVLAGLAWNAAGAPPLPPLADDVLATLGQAVVPFCLVLIGVSLAHYDVRGALRGATAADAAEGSSMPPLAVFVFARFAIRP